MPDRLKIPYEKIKGTDAGSHAPTVSFFVTNRQYEIPYTKVAVESGTYREWITQLSVDELNGFIELNKKKLQAAIDRKLMGPSFREQYYWRNTMYELELLYRQYGPKLSEDVLERWYDDMLAEKRYWEGKYAVARKAWQDKAGVTPDEDASLMTSYY